MVKSLVHYKDPILTEPVKAYVFTTPEESIAYAKELVETMLEHEGIGLAANQIGDPYAVFCVASNPVIVCFNPFILDFSSESVTLEEGCLTYPGLVVNVTRPKHIKLRYTQPNGETVTQTYTGLTARIIQHEMEHLNGQRFFDHTDWYGKEKTKRWFKKRKKYELHSR
jgi:peptide deformylase